jgi:hypothetical protein
MSKRSVELLLGDNPFHGISHLSQERARLPSREECASNAEYASQIVRLSMQNGATGFLFSVSETTLSILKQLHQDELPDLYAIVPYAYDYVRLATKTGGISSLAKRLIRQMVFSTNVKVVALNFVGFIRADLSAFLKTYLAFEISRIKSIAGKSMRLRSVLLHEIITDMALALNLDWLFKSYIDFMIKSKNRPGFETRNFAYMINKFKIWGIDSGKVTIATPFNKVGFQMNPSKAECEKTLAGISGTEIIAMSILAAGYLKPPEAIRYVINLPNITHMVVGVSKKQQATETFTLLRRELKIAQLAKPSNIVI